MTFSLVGRCRRTGQIGVAAVTANPAVGKLVSHAMAGIGAIATQAYTNPYYGIDGLELLKRGGSADAVLDELLANDPQRQKRQVAILGRTGPPAVWSGNRISAWGGHLTGDDFAAQGNRLTSSQVVETIAATFAQREELKLAERLLAAIEAGHARGGDRQEERSGVILVYDTEEYPLWDIRADDADDPVAELHRLHDVIHRKLLPQVLKLPTRRQPEGQLTDDQQGIG